MPVFRYKAFDAQGKIVKGTVDEENRRVAIERLKQQGYIPTEVVNQDPAAKVSAQKTTSVLTQFNQRISLREIAMFTRQLSTLVGAGLQLVDALTATLEQNEKSALQRMIAGVRDLVNEGIAFADALRRYPKAFNDLYVNMVRAGEQSGTLEIVLERLADFLDGQIELRNNVAGTLAYPIIMFLAMLGVIGILFVFVIPKLVQVFEQTGQELPLPTRILLGITTLVSNYGIWLLIGAIAFVLTIRWYLRTPKGKARWDRLSLKLPIFGLLAANVAMSRFAKTLSTLLSSGVPLPISLQITREVVGNIVYADAVEKVHDAVIEGGGLAAPLRKVGVFPPTMVRMVAAGEQSGELEQMLVRVAHAYDREVALRLTIVTRLLEPILILIMGGLVFFIMLSILVPMFKINQMVG